MVETDDAVLIADRSQAQSIKTVVEQLEADGSPEGKAHRKIYRPWGAYTGVVEDHRWQVKRISVAGSQFVAADAPPPGRTLGRGSRNGSGGTRWRRTAAWRNQSTYIPMGCKHRLSNPGKIR